MKSEKNNNDYNKMIVIPPSNEVDVKSIVASIKSRILKTKMSYLNSLHENPIHFIDTWENGEYLVDGWYEPENIQGTRARWTKRAFSFLFNPSNSNHIILNVVAIPTSKSKLKLTLFIGEKKIESTIIDVVGEIQFKIPKIINSKNILFKFLLSEEHVPAKITGKLDNRKLGIAVKSISTLEQQVDASIYYKPLFEDSIIIKNLEMKLNSHINPEAFISYQSKLGFLKKILFRSFKIFTRVQVVFNRLTFESITNLHKYLDDLYNYNKHLEKRINEISRTGQDNKKPTFFDQIESDFYIYQQEKFRGSEELVISRMNEYKKYVKTVKKLNEQHPFIDIGFGRGEFFNILKNAGISNIIGVDINHQYVYSAQINGYSVSQGDAIEYLNNYQGKFSGASAFHLIEHLTFPHIYDLLYLIYEKLEKNGIIILETPNPENLQVASTIFYTDYTHKYKLSPALLELILEYIGYKNIQILRLTPMVTGVKTEVDRLLFGSQEYAIIAYKK